MSWTGVGLFSVMGEVGVYIDRCEFRLYLRAQESSKTMAVTPDTVMNGQFKYCS